MRDEGRRTRVVERHGKDKPKKCVNKTTEFIRSYDLGFKIIIYQTHET
mgnify:CR=1 FL=1